MKMLPDMHIPLYIQGKMAEAENKGKKVSLHNPDGSWLPELNPVSVAWREGECYYSLLDGMLVHCKVSSQHYITGTYLYTPGWRERQRQGAKFLV